MPTFNLKDDRCSLVKFKIKCEISKCKSTSVSMLCLYANKVQHGVNTTKNTSSLLLPYLFEL